MSTEPNPPETPPETEETPEAEEGLVVTVRDVEYTIPPEARDDFELLDDLNEMDQSRNPVRLPSILRRLLGDVQTRAVLDLLRDPKTGRVPIAEGREFVYELIDSLNPN